MGNLLVVSVVTRLQNTNKFSLDGHVDFSFYPGVNSQECQVIITPNTFAAFAGTIYGFC